MNTILLQPTDVLFFRDGRPMGGASSGHGAAWPLPSVVNHAFHAALHRSGIESHKHVPGRSSAARDYSDAHRDESGRQFGSLVTAGPFPVQILDDHGEPIQPVWHFPRPADADDSGNVVLLPCQPVDGSASSLCPPARFPVASSKPPSKDTPKPWWPSGLWEKYLGSNNTTHAAQSVADSAFSDVEHSYGIGINSDTGTVEEGHFYSAHYLRLRPGWRLGVHAEAKDKAHGCQDIIPQLISQDHNIITGGQQRVCTAERLEGETMPLPCGAAITGTRVKWVLLTPAIFPQINDHTGGWLPSWIRHTDGKVMLKDGDTERRQGERRDQWRKRVAALPEIAAHLVAAIVGKPIPVTGYALPNDADPDRAEGGAKSTHLAVPAGAVYYFEADSPEAAASLAAALNWHGNDAATIRNRRSTLMGEKGFGLGVCGAWHFHECSDRSVGSGQSL